MTLENAVGGRVLSAIPASLPEGTYYIGVVADPVPGEPNVLDNAYAESFVVTRTPGAISISDVTVAQGNGGTTFATFMVTRTGGTAAFDVGFAIADGGATVADGGYLPVSGTLTFDEFVVMRTVTVAGFSRADLDSGRLQVTFGSSDASGPYMHITGVA